MTTDDILTNLRDLRDRAENERDILDQTLALLEARSADDSSAPGGARAEEADQSSALPRLTEAWVEYLADCGDAGREPLPYAVFIEIARDGLRGGLTRTAIRANLLFAEQARTATPRVLNFFETLNPEPKPHR